MKLLLVLAIVGLPYPHTLYAEQTAAISADEDDAADFNPEPTSQDQDGEYLDAEPYDSSYSDGDFIEGMGSGQGDSYSETPLSIQIQAGRKWYKDNSFTLDIFEFITEWYLFESFPVKVGPTLSYNKFTHLSSGVAGGQILEIGLRASFFWDFGTWSPYFAMKYTMISSGSIDIKRQDGDTLERGSLDIDISGLNLIAGGQVMLAKQVYITLEGSLVNEEKIKQSGSLATVTRDENNAEVTRGSRLITESATKKFQSLSLGVLFEL